jgi:hypothetical protein
MSLSYTTARAALSGAFTRQVVNGVLGAMAATRMVGRGAGSPFSPANAAIAMVACALSTEKTAPGAALALALMARDWRATSPAPGHRWALGVGGGRLGNGALRDIRLLRVLCAQIYLQQPTAWWISAVECIGGGLCFSRGDYDGRVPEGIKRTWVTVPAWVVKEFGRCHGIATEDQQKMNLLLLGRITKSLRAEPPGAGQIEEAAE